MNKPNITSLLITFLVLTSFSFIAKAEENQLVDIETGEPISLEQSLISKKITSKMSTASGTEDAVDIVISELKEIDTGVECGLASEYRFATNNQFDGKDIDVLVKVGSSISFRNDGGTKCLDTDNGVLEFIVLGNGTGPSFANFTLNVVEADTNTPIKANSLLMTALDLDTANDGSISTDDVFFKGPETLLVSSESNVTALNGSFFGGFSHKLKGNTEGNCNDQLASRDLTCSGAALFDSKGIGIRDIEFKIQNDQTDSLRFFIISLRLIDAVGLDNRPPVAVLEGFPTSGIAPLVSSFSAINSTDEDGAIVSYSWDFGDGNTSNDAITDHTYTQEGLYTVTLTVTDDEGASGFSTIEVNVGEQADTTPPVIRLNGDSIASIQLGSSYDEMGATAIDDRDGPVQVTISGLVDTSTIGNYTITYTATDAAGNIGTLTREVRVDQSIFPDTTPPVITVNGSSTLTIELGTTFSAPEASAIDDRDGEVPVSLIQNVDTSTLGEYLLTYRASDSSGNIASVTRTITVIEVIHTNDDPVARISSNTTSGIAPLSVFLDASTSSDSDGEIVSYLWSFNDGTTESASETVRVYLIPGDYDVTLLVTDNEGATNSSTITISVNEETEVVSYLKVVDTEGGYHHLKIGHNPDNLWKPKVSPADGNDTLSIRIRAESNIDWDKLEVVPQSQDWRGVVSLGDYIDGNPEGWIDVNIPLSDYPAGAFDDITLLSFFTRGIDPFSICIERIEFVGSNNFLWFGAPDKLDVAFDTPFNASVVTVDPSGPTHLQVIDTNGGWQHLKIGHNPDNLWNPKISPVGNNDSITIRVKAGDGVDWNKLQIIPQGKPERGRATLGDYLPANTDGWFDIVIPLADYSGSAFDDISLISLYGSGTDPFEIGLESIIFTGGEEFIWFGAPGTSSVSLQTDWFTQLIVANQTEAAQSRMAKKGLLDIQQPAQEPAQAPIVEAVSTGGGGSLPLHSLLGLLLLLGLRRQQR